MESIRKFLNIVLVDYDYENDYKILKHFYYLSHNDVYELRLYHERHLRNPEKYDKLEKVMSDYIHEDKLTKFKRLNDILDKFFSEKLYMKADTF